MKRIRNILALALVLSMTLSMALSDSLSLRCAIDEEKVLSAADSLGLSEKQTQHTVPVIALINALRIQFTPAQSGEQINVFLNDQDILDAALRAEEDSLLLGSSLIPNHLIRIRPEDLTGMVHAVSGTSGGGSGAAITELFRPYAEKALRLSASLVTPGEVEKGEYTCQGIDYDLHVPLKADMESFRVSLREILREMLEDEKVMEILPPVLAAGGLRRDADALMELYEQFEAHFPGTVLADYYTRSDNPDAVSMTGAALFEGMEKPGFEYAVSLEDQNLLEAHLHSEVSQFFLDAVSADHRLVIDITMGDLTGRIDLYPDDSRTGTMDLYFMDMVSPLLRLSLTLSQDSPGVMILEDASRRILSMEDLLNRKTGASARLLADFAAHGLKKLTQKIHKAFPESESFLSAVFSLPGSGKSKTQPAPSPEKKTIRLGSSCYTLDVPASFVEGELTEEEIDDGIVAYWYSPDSSMDFDIYQFPKEEGLQTAAELCTQEAEEFEADLVNPGITINGIPAAVYLAVESFDYVDYQTANYILEDGEDFVEIVFWLDGETAVQEVEEILRTLTFVQR